MNTLAQRIVILAAIDDSSTGTRVVANAARFATAPGAELHVVHVIDVPDVKRLSTQLEAGRALLEIATRGIIDPIMHLAAGAPVVEILQLAANLQADMLVLGTQELSAIDRLLLGSVVEPVTRRAQCPVFIVRPKGYSQKVVAEIEPPCAACLETQRATSGKQLWCARHSQRHVHGHLHYEIPESFAVGSNLLRPTA